MTGVPTRLAGRGEWCARPPLAATCRLKSGKQRLLGPHDLSELTAELFAARWVESTDPRDAAQEVSAEVANGAAVLGCGAVDRTVVEDRLEAVVLAPDDVEMVVRDDAADELTAGACS